MEKRIKKIFVFLFLICWSNHSAAQVVYENLYQDSGIRAGYAISPTKDNGYIIAGFNNPSNSINGERLCVLKIDSLGLVEWANYYDEGYSTMGRDIIQTYDNGYLVIGGQSNPLTISSDVFVMHLNSDGVFEWSKLYGDTLSDYSYDVMEVQSDSGFVIAGNFGDYPCLLRFNKYGDTLWTKTYQDTAVFTGVALSSDNGFVLSGTNYVSGVNRGYVVKTNSVGSEEWVREFIGGIGTEVFFDLVVYDGDSIAVVGYSQVNSAPPKVDAIIRILDSFGNLIDFQTYGGIQNDYFYGICRSSNGQFTMAGTTWYSVVDQENGVYAVQTDKSANLIWEQGFGDFNGTQYGYDICPASDGGFVICGQKTGSGSKLYVIKLNENGNTVSMIEIPSLNDFTIYPNPMIDQTLVSFSKPLNQKNTLKIFSMKGELLFSEYVEIGTLSFQIKRENLSSGIYMVVISDGKITISKRIVVA